MRKLNFNSIVPENKRGATAAVTTAIGVVVLLILISALAPTALVGLFNATAFTGVPAWVTTALGALGAIAFVYIIWRAASGAGGK